MIETFPNTQKVDLSIALLTSDPKSRLDFYGKWSHLRGYHVLCYDVLELTLSWIYVVIPLIGFLSFGKIF